MTNIPPGRGVLLTNFGTVLSILGNTGQPLKQLVCHLIAAPFTVTVGLDCTTLVEATFGGYAAETVSRGAQTPNPDGSVTLAYGNATFTAVSPSGPQLIYGYALTKVGDPLALAIAVQRFQSPQPIVANGDTVTVDEPGMTFGYGTFWALTVGGSN
jgi:hypothetical protein